MLAKHDRMMQLNRFDDLRLNAMAGASVFRTRPISLILGSFSGMLPAIRSHCFCAALSVTAPAYASA